MVFLQSFHMRGTGFYIFAGFYLKVSSRAGLFESRLTLTQD